ncbi:MAG: hypothetical protein J6D35_02405, partial [Chryseobacterium sp.]|nr:hypothetical protein [Chryseobacterium sp.]
HIIFILKSGVKALLPGIFLLLLFLFKSIWVFGYPVFPVQFIDLDWSWKPNVELLRNSSEMAIQKTYDMQFTTAEIAKFSSLDYLKNWLFLDGIKGKIHLFFIISLLFFLVFAVRQKSKVIWLLFTAIMFKTFLVLIFSAQYRFFLDVFFVIFYIIFYKTFTQKRCIAMFGVLSLAVALLLSFPVLMIKVSPGFKLGNFMTGFSKNQWYKPSYFELNKFKSYQIGNLKFNVVQNYPFSFDTPLPAISPQFIQEDLDAGIFPQLKGKTLKEGFIWRKISEEEKIQIQEILDDWAAENHD